jgi:hypothetical protein
MFIATRGTHLNSTDFFRARALEERKKEAAKLCKIKEQRLEQIQVYKDAEEIILKKGPLKKGEESKHTKKEIATLLPWKLGTSGGNAKKEELIKKYYTAPKPKLPNPWSEQEEQQLKNLENDDVNLADTAIGDKTRQHARAVANHVKLLDKETKAKLRTALAEDSTEDNSEDNTSNNVI